MAELVLQTGRKHWTKEKLLALSNFFFFLSVLKRLTLQALKIQGFFGKGLNMVGKAENTGDIFSFSHHVLYPNKDRKLMAILAIFDNYVVCKFSGFGQVQNLSHVKELKKNLAT